MLVLVSIFYSPQSEYLKKSNEKRAAQRREKKMEFYNFHQTQEQNAQYEELMAEKRQQHRSQFINDLDQQMQLKTMQKVRSTICRLAVVN